MDKLTVKMIVKRVTHYCALLQLVRVLMFAAFFAYASILIATENSNASVVSDTNQATQTANNAATESPNEPLPLKSSADKSTTNRLGILADLIQVIVFLVGIILTFYACIKRRRVYSWLMLKYLRLVFVLKDRTIWQQTPPAALTRRNGLVRYGVAVFQDTILPVFFDYVHRRALERHGLRIEFVQMEWDECLAKFEANEIDVALHNLSSVVPYFAKAHAKGSEPETLPSVFVPFFDFCGQGVFIRRAVLDRLDSIATLKNFKSVALEKPNGLFESAISDQQRQLVLSTLLSNTKAIVATGTDLEVAINNLYDLAGFDPNAQPPAWNVERAHTEKGYEMFIDPTKEFDVYCGGLIQLFKLQRLNDPAKTKVVQLCTGKELHVSSANGLVTTHRFAADNPGVVRDLAHIWFWSINQFMTDVSSCIASTARHCDIQRLESIAAFLEQTLNTSQAINPKKPVDLQINAELLKMMFNHDYEDFYKDCASSFRRFYGSRQDSDLNQMIPVAHSAAKAGRAVSGATRSQVANAAVERIVERMIDHHRRLFPRILPEAC